MCEKGEGAQSTHARARNARTQNRARRYEVRDKKKNALEDIKETIMERFLERNGRVQCGIIYCLSRNDCEKVAAELREMFKSERKARLSIE